jgi:uncharacterized membrane protein YhhN
MSFAVAHVIYFTAFGIKPFNFRLACPLVACAVPVLALYIPFLSGNLLKVLVPTYMLLLLAMLWRAVSRLQIFNKNLAWTWTKMCCSIGALLFVISDSVLSFNLFIFTLPYSHQLVMSTYYAAQLGIALSMVDSHASNEVNAMVIQHGDLVKGVKLVVANLKSIYFEDNLELINTHKEVDIDLISSKKL